MLMNRFCGMHVLSIFVEWLCKMLADGILEQVSEIRYPASEKSRDLP